MTDDRYGKEADEGGFSQNCSLRDYFAGQAVIALVSSRSFLFAVSRASTDDAGIMREIAISSYQLADAMLKERAK